MISRQQLEIILAVEETGSLSKAAEKLYTSQPALSIAIKNLEEELGVSLFIRKSNGTQLSAVCRDILPYINGVIDNMNKIQSTCTEYYFLNNTNINDFLITLYAPPLLATSIFPKTVAKLATVLPSLKVNTKNISSGQIHQPLKENELILYVKKHAPLSIISETTDTSVDHEIALLSPCVMMHKNRAKKYNGFITEQELIELPIATIHGGTALGALFNETYLNYFKSLNKDLNITECCSINVINSLCETDHAVSIGIQFSGISLIGNANDTVVLPLNHSCPETLYLSLKHSHKFPDRLFSIIQNTLIESIS